MSDRGTAGHPATPPGPWHWTAAALGLLLVVATVAFLVRDGVVRRRAPHPVLEVTVDTVAAAPGGHVVRVRVRNRGGGTAASVRVVGELRDAQGVVEEAETSVDYVPPTSVRDAGLMFARDPRGLRLVVRPTGYDVP